MTFVFAAIILNEARKNRIDMVITEKKGNRAIFLLNRVKIKYMTTWELDKLIYDFIVKHGGIPNFKGLYG